jgi:hypothetical protein
MVGQGPRREAASTATDHERDCRVGGVSDDDTEPLSDRLRNNFPFSPDWSERRVDTVGRYVASRSRKVGRPQRRLLWIALGPNP